MNTLIIEKEYNMKKFMDSFSKAREIDKFEFLIGIIIYAFCFFNYFVAYPDNDLDFFACFVGLFFMWDGLTKIKEY